MIGQRWIPTLLLLASLAACKNPRPTEFINITFTPSVDTENYESWNFDLDACLDVDDPRVDKRFLREQLLLAIRAELESRGYAYRENEAPDFLVFYELRLADGGGLKGVKERSRGRILIRDVATGRLVWMGERKKPTGAALTEEESIVQIRLFAHELLQYTRKLDDPE